MRAELDRAGVVALDQTPPSVVTMNSMVRFATLSSQEKLCLTLVYRRDIDAASEQISILAPINSALLALATGDHIEWSGAGGHGLKVRIIKAVYQPERAGEFHR